MYVANSGKIPPKIDRINVFAAMADAANMRYESTM
jgi:hypothetical protein